MGCLITLQLAGMRARAPLSALAPKAGPYLPWLPLVVMEGSTGRGSKNEEHVDVPASGGVMGQGAVVFLPLPLQGDGV